MLARGPISLPSSIIDTNKVVKVRQSVCSGIPMLALANRLWTSPHEITSL